MENIASDSLMNILPGRYRHYKGKEYRVLIGAMFSGFLPLGMVVFGPLADIVSMCLLMILSGALLLVLAAFCRRMKEFEPVSLS